MTDPTTPAESTVDIAGLPMQPTGSGVADLEIAFERMKLAEADGEAPAEPLPSSDAAEESAAHPS